MSENKLFVIVIVIVSRAKGGLSRLCRTYLGCGAYLGYAHTGPTWDQGLPGLHRAYLG